MNAELIAGLAVLPWVIVPLVVLLRVRRGTLLESISASVPASHPLVSVVVPARNEARNIEACVRSILASSWPALEIIVVDDESTDDTAALANTVARNDPRVRVIEAPALPPGWFGKQWACHTGAATARGDFLLFTDADTIHGPDLLTRAMNAARERGAELFSVGGAQTMGTFWEQLLQPHIFWLIAARFGNPDVMSRNRNPIHKIANGQFMLTSRSVYEAEGGHAAVRAHVAEDLRLAQDWTRRGRSVQLMTTQTEFQTRMYHGLREVLRGWGKNLYAAGRDTFPFGPAGQLLLRIIFPAPTLWEIAPAVAALAWLAGMAGSALGTWGLAAYLCNTVARAALHQAMRAPLWIAALNPLAATIVCGISARAAWRGSQVQWKDRTYTSA